MSGVDGKLLKGLIERLPFFKLYRLLITKSKSEVFLTGKKRLRGTFKPVKRQRSLMLLHYIIILSFNKIPIEPSKHFIAAPTAVSSWMTFTPLSKVFGLTITSISSVPFSIIRLIEGSLTHKLFVLKNLNVLIDLKSSTFSLGTWAISNKRNLFSYWIRVPP